MPNPDLPRPRRSRAAACFPWLCLAFSTVAAPRPVDAQRAGAAAEACAAAPETSAREVLDRAWAALGLAARPDAVVRIDAVDHAQQNYQSDRPYPPYFVNALGREVWFDPRTGVERISTTFTGQGSGPVPSGTTLVSAAAAYAVRDTARAPTPPAFGQAQQYRPLDVFAALHDWRAAADVRVAGRCVLRDYPRVVLTRRGSFGPERLYLDPRSGLPVALRRAEAHYLWGSVDARYEWVTWYGAGGLTFPLTAVRTVDGEVETTRAFGAIAFAARDGAPALELPAGAAPMRPVPARFLQPIAPDTVRVGAHAFLLVNPGYNELVALVRDTVFVFDATQGEARARQDSAWVGRLFPGRHPVVLVVTDLAWPHVGGVRFWVASGAAVVSHRNSRAFLERVVDRRWTGAPDLLERRRATARLRFAAVDGAADRAGGGVRLAAIDGIGSEGALVAYLPGERFLWAGDYVQDATAPALTTAEVVRAARRAGFDPARLAAQHVGIIPWATVAALAERLP
ncbi:MAG: beta-lactamase protein [Gemmatimonadetes bacterium]|nr:beta-lactamase protein [Gemmatimonadota bacterium]